MGEEILRKICGPMVDQGIRWIGTNPELRELHKHLDVVTDIKNKILGRIGQLERIDHGKVVKKIFESKLDGRRRLEDLDWDGWKMLKRIYGRWSLKMATEGSEKRRIGVCNWGCQSSQEYLEPRSE